MPVSANELLMRRVPGGKDFFNPTRPAVSPLGVTALAFRPTTEDSKGISLSRMQSAEHPEFLTLEAFATNAYAGKSPDKYGYVAVLSAAELLDSNGLALELIPDPTNGDPGHTLLPFLHTDLDKQVRNDLMFALAREHCLRVVGPFNCNGIVTTANRVDWNRV